MPFRFDAETPVAAPPDRVFAALGDVESYGRWMRNFVAAERLTPPPTGKGTRWRETRRMFGREASEEFEIAAWDPPREVVLAVDGRKGSTGRGTYRFRYTCVPRDGGSLLRMEAEISMGGGFADLLCRLFGGSMRKACAADLESFARWAGSGRPA